MSKIKTVDEILTDFAHERDLAIANNTDIDVVYAEVKAELSKHMREVAGKEIDITRSATDFLIGQKWHQNRCLERARERGYDV